MYLVNTLQRFAFMKNKTSSWGYFLLIMRSGFLFIVISLCLSQTSCVSRFGQNIREFSHSYEVALIPEDAFIYRKQNAWYVGSFTGSAKKTYPLLEFYDINKDGSFFGVKETGFDVVYYQISEELAKSIINRKKLGLEAYGEEIFDDIRRINSREDCLEIDEAYKIKIELSENKCRYLVFPIETKYSNTVYFTYPVSYATLVALDIPITLMVNVPYLFVRGIAGCVNGYE